MFAALPFDIEGRLFGIVLDLALDTRAAPLPTRAVPWKRFMAALKARGLAEPQVGNEAVTSRP